MEYRLMKHLKTFESVGNHTFTIVHFPEGEGVHAIYIDGVLEKYGDYYHDKIQNWIEGFLSGSRWAGIEFEERKITCKDPELNEEICELGGIPPKHISGVK